MDHINFISKLYVEGEDSVEVSRKHQFEYFIVQVLKKLFMQASETALKFYEFTFFFLLCHVFRVRRNVIQTNLNIAFPDLPEEERDQIMIDNYHWFARVLIAITRLDYWKGRTDQAVTFHGLSELDDALTADKGIVMVSSHLGHWEIVVPALAEKGYQMHIYVGEQKNPLVNTMQNKTRGSFGVQTIDKSRSASFQMMRALKKQNVLALAVDQNDHNAGFFVKFFGKEAASPRTVAGFHLSRKSPIIVSSCFFVEDKVELHFEKLEVELVGDKEQDQFNITQAINDAFERNIRKHPEQYFWMHKRWKTRPPYDSTPIY